MIKAVSAVAVAALIAGVVTFFPSLSPRVEASTPVASAPAVLNDEPRDGAAADACARAWPYYDGNCLRAQKSDAKQVRIITTDRVSGR